MAMYLLPWYVILPTGATTTAVPVQKTSSASSNSSTGTGRSSTWWRFVKAIWNIPINYLTSLTDISLPKKQSDPYECTYEYMHVHMYEQSFPWATVLKAFGTNNHENPRSWPPFIVNQFPPFELFFFFHHFSISWAKVLPIGLSHGWLVYGTVQG